MPESSEPEPSNLRRPKYVDWPLFPFEGELRLKQPTFRPDPPRSGEPGGSACEVCAYSDDEYIWVDDHWRVCQSPSAQSSVPALVLLETREHMDLDGLTDALAAELGPMIMRIERAIHAVGNIGRVHVYRWGDGASHFHMWFYGRPAGVMSMLGFGMPFWEPVLAPTPDDVWEQNLAIVARELAKDGGQAIV